VHRSKLTAMIMSATLMVVLAAAPTPARAAVHEYYISQAAPGGNTGCDAPSAQIVADGLDEALTDVLTDALFAADDTVLVYLCGQSGGGEVRYTLDEDVVELEGGFDLEVRGVTYADESVAAPDGFIILDGGEDSSPFQLTDVSLTLKNLGIEYGQADEGGAIGLFADDEAEVSLDLHAVLIDSSVSTDDGGAIHVDGPVVMANSVISGSGAASGDGGAIWTSGSIQVTDSGFTNNNADGQDGGAIWTGEGGTITRTSFEDNDANDGSEEGRGGAVYSEGALTVIDSEFQSNGAQEHGGAIYSSCDVSIEGGEFDENSSQVNGGALYVADTAGGCEDVELSVVGTLFSDNGDADYSTDNGGAIFADLLFAVSVDEVLFSALDSDGEFIDEVGNYAVLDGGAVYVQGGDGVLTSVLVSDSVFDYSIAAGSLEDAGFGGALYLGCAAATVRGTEFNHSSASGGTAAAGGAIYATDYDGCGDVGDYEIVVSSSTFTSNFANDQGGAIASEQTAGAEGPEQLQAFTVSSSTFVDNSSGWQGGAINIDERSLTVSNSVFRSNSSVWVGGAIETWTPAESGSSVSIVGSTFIANEISGFMGGAVMLNDVGPATVRNNLFKANRATSGFDDLSAGGAIGFTGWHSTNVLISRNRFVSNLAKRGGVFAVDLPSDVSDRAVAKAFSRNTYSLNSASVGGRVGFFLYDDWVSRTSLRRLEKAVKGNNRLIGPKRGLVYQEAD